MIFTSSVVLGACGNKNDNTVESDTAEVTEVTENISDTAEETATETENKNNENNENVPTSSFDDEYYKGLLVSGYWLQKSGSLIYTFDDSGSYTLEDYSGNEQQSGVYYFKGTDLSPILCLEYDSDSSEYEIVFNSNSHMSWTNSSGNQMILDNSSEKPTSGSKGSENGYTVSFETLDENVQYPCIGGWSLEDKQNELNEMFKQDQEDTIAEYKTNNATYSISFEVKYSDSELLSIVGTGVTYYDGAAHPNNFYKTYNINMKSGEILSLSDAIDIETAAKNIFNNSNCESVDSENISIQDIIDINVWTTEQEVIDYLNYCDMFYYNENGKVCIYFVSIYALGTYSAVAFD